MKAFLKFILALIVVVVPVALVQVGFAQLGIAKSTRHMLAALVSIPACYLAYWAYVRYVEKRPVTELAPQGALAELGWGALIGAGLLVSTIGVLATVGMYRINGVGLAADMAGPLAQSLAAAVTEEIVFRGVFFRLSEASLGTPLALSISAAVFGLIHLLNGHATLQGALSIIFEAGILLAAAFLLTRRLWFPMGMHFAWNFTQGAIFGVAVSGGATSGLFRGELSGPTWLSGGSFGAEGSLVAVVLCASVGIVLLRKAWQRHGFVRPFWLKLSA
jgi:CAAX protease family protein